LENYYDEVGVEGGVEGTVVKGAEKEKSSSRGMGI
jgi:hypothetical protein